MPGIEGLQRLREGPNHSLVGQRFLEKRDLDSGTSLVAVLWTWNKCQILHLRQIDGDCQNLSDVLISFRTKARSL
jgi:hypothetical protein